MISTPSLRHQGVPGTNRVYKGDNYVTLFTLLSSDWISTPSLRHQGVLGTNRVYKGDICYRIHTLVI